MNKLMDGITILNQTEIMVTPDWMFTTLVIGVAMFFIFAFVCMATNGFISDISGIISIIGLISVAFIAIASCFIEEATGEYTYDCLIEEDISLIEFYEKYEVIEVNGKIWTIKEK